MTTLTITVTEALSELKTLEKRIDEAIRTSTYCTTAMAGIDKINGKSKKDAIANMQGDYDKLKSLIAKNNAIKAALSESNAKTKITVNGIQYTIAEAIYHKTKGIEIQKKFLKSISRQYDSCIDKINSNNGEALAKKCEQHLIEMYGGKDIVASMNADALNAARDAYKTNNMLELIEGVNIKSVIEKMSDEIDAFESQVDAAITIKNATTKITVSYDG